MVGTAQSIEITKVSYQVQSTDACLCYQRLRVSCTLRNNFQAATCRLRSGGSPFFMINHRSSIICNMASKGSAISSIVYSYLSPREYRYSLGKYQNYPEEQSSAVVKRCGQTNDRTMIQLRESLK